MKNAIAFALMAFILSGCAQQEYSIPDNAGTSAGEPEVPVAQQGFSEAKIRYDIIDGDKKTSAIIDDDGSITVILKQADSKRQEMRSEKIDGQEVKQIVLDLQEKDFFSFPDSFGDFGSKGTTRVLELSVDGKTKNIACQNECPQNISGIIQQIESIVSGSP